MPKYKITDNKTGKSLIVSGDAPPNEQTVSEIFAQHGGTQRQQQAQPQDQSLLQPLTQPARELPQAGRMMQRGSIVGGGAKAGNAALGVALSPFGIADKAIRSGADFMQQLQPNSGVSLATNTALDLLGLLPRIGGQIGEAAAKAGIGLTGGIFGHNLGTSPENASDIYRELPKLGATVGSVALPAPIAKGIVKAAPVVGGIAEQGINKVGDAIETHNNKMVGKEFRQLSPPSTAASKATIAKNFDSRVAQAVPEIQKDIRSAGGIDKVFDKNSDVPKVEQLTDFVGKTKQRIWNEVTQKTDPIKGEVFDTKLSKDKVLKDVTDNMTEFQTADLAKNEKFLEAYDKQTTISGVQKEIARLNKETEAYEYANTTTKHKMRVDDPLLDTKIRLRDQLREDMLNQIEASGISGVRELRQKYGSVAEVHKGLLNNLEKNKNLDKKGGWFGVFKSTPMAVSLLTGIVTKLASDNPALLGVEGVAGGTALYNKYRQKPSPTSARIVRRLQ